MKINEAKLRSAIIALLGLYEGHDDDGMKKFLAKLEAIGIPPEDPRPKIIQASVELLMEENQNAFPDRIIDALKDLGDEFE